MTARTLPLLLALAGLSVHPAAAQHPLIPNPGLEASTSGDWPDQWGGKPGAGGWLSEAGNHFIRLEALGPDRVSMLYRPFQIPADGAFTKFQLTYRARSNGIQRGPKEWFDARVIVKFVDAAGKEREASGTQAFAGTRDWMAYEQKGAIPEGTASVIVMPMVFHAQAGSFDFDDMQLNLYRDQEEYVRPELSEAERQAWDARDAKLQAKAEAAAKKRAELEARLEAMGREPVLPLMANEDFESSASGLWPDHWGGKPGAGSWVGEGANHFIRLMAGGKDKVTMLYRVADIPKGYAKAQVSYVARVNELKAGEKPWHDARVVVKFVSAERKEVEAPGTSAFKGTSDWRTVHRVADLPSDTVQVILMPMVTKAESGSFDLDNLQVTLYKAGEEVVAPALTEKEQAALDADNARRKEVQAMLSALPAKPFKASRLPLAVEDTLRVDGNRLRNARKEEVWLQGVAIPSLDWSLKGERLMPSVAEAVTHWNVNVIRLGVVSPFWFGRGGKNVPAQEDGGTAYRALVDQVIDTANTQGVYIVLDLHEYKAPTEGHAEFWRDAAARYANRPGVLFDLLNEPHGISWEEWSHGGELQGVERAGVAVENEEARDVTRSIGMRKLLETVRGTGARNLAVVGGLDWAYDLTGILQGHALEDPDGNGVMYSAHIYPWKSDWNGKVLDIARKHPVFVGEVGAHSKKMPWESTFEDPCQWSQDMLSVIQEYRLNWTGWSFHPGASPCLLADWDFRPTTHWGLFAKAALEGVQFPAGKRR